MSPILVSLLRLVHQHHKKNRATSNSYPNITFGTLLELSIEYKIILYIQLYLHFKQDPL